MRLLHLLHLLARVSHHSCSPTAEKSWKYPRKQHMVLPLCHTYSTSETLIMFADHMTTHHVSLLSKLT